MPAKQINLVCLLHLCLHLYLHYICNCICICIFICICICICICASLNPGAAWEQSSFQTSSPGTSTSTQNLLQKIFTISRQVEGIQYLSQSVFKENILQVVIFHLTKKLIQRKEFKINLSHSKEGVQDKYFKNDV